MSTFKAYLITPPAGPREFDTVRDRAKSKARAIGGESVEVELPATKSGLIPYLNELERFHAGAEAPAPAEAEPAPVAAPRPPMPVPPPSILTASSVAQWVMDSASQAEVEQVFTALGVRFGEAIRPRRAA